MTIGEIRSLLLTADPDIKHYFSMSNDDAYSYWEETQRLPTVADDGHSEEAWRFYVHRFTRDDCDRIAPELFYVLDTCPHVAVSWQKDFEPDTGYIHHIFTCEGY